MPLLGTLRLFPLLDLLNHFQDHSGELTLELPSGEARLRIESGVLTQLHLGDQAVPLPLLPWVCVDLARADQGQFRYDPHACPPEKPLLGWPLGCLLLWLSCTCAELDDGLSLPAELDLFVVLGPRTRLEPPLLGLWEAVAPLLERGQCVQDLRRTLPLLSMGLRYGLYKLSELHALEPLTPTLEGTLRLEGWQPGSGVRA